MQEAKQAILRLALTPGIGARAVAKLRKKFGSLQAATEAPAAAWEVAGVPPGLHGYALSRKAATAAETVREQCKTLGISMVFLGTRDYPEQLAAIFDPPPVLYLRGRLPPAELLASCVGIVGTRKASNQGLSFTYRVAGELSEAGAVIASGLAMGVDAEAHRAVVDRAGIGIGVLAGGVESVHPPANRALAESLCERGCLLSEHPPGTSPRAAFFVGRNRLISGLSQAVAVIEAGQKSGALLTANFAMEQGRSVFVMPGRPGDPRVAGSLPLLRDGAGLLLCAADIAVELGLTAGIRGNQEIAELGDDAALFAGTDSAAGASFDAIMVASGLSVPKLLAQLSRLELAGRIRRGSDGLYYRLK